MKTNKRSIAMQRQMLDRAMRKAGATVVERPHAGWLKATRVALGLSLRQMAKRLGVSPTAVAAAERNEVSGVASLANIERSARAMDCRLVYALVPQVGAPSLEAILEGRSRELARKLLRGSAHHMRLEGQAVSPADQESQVAALAAELKAKVDPRLWEGRP
jgi:predicted DNA-binding mobile mystery protein A